MMSNKFLKKLQNFIFQEKLFERGDKLIVGISGGADSTGLTLALKKLQTKYNLKLCLVHINYHQRGEDSKKDQKFVEKFAKENELELTVFDYPEPFGSGHGPEPDGSGRSTEPDGSGHSPVPCGSRQVKKGNLEELLRDFRYQKFEEVRGKLNFDKVVVAHHLDDQVETFWMNLLRGAGVQGLTGMAVKNDYLIRPFLNFSKQEIETFLKEKDQDFRLDKTNLEATFTRNKIRLKLIPFLEENFNPKIKEGLAKLVVNLKDEMELNDFLIEQIYLDLIKKDKNKIVLDVSKLEEFPVGGQKKIFRKIILELKGDLKNISNNNFLEFKKIIESQKNKKQRMKIEKISLEKNGKYVIFRGV